MAHSASHRLESRGAHVRLDAYRTRDDRQYLQHSIVHYRGEEPPLIDYAPVVITRSPPQARSYGGAGAAAVLT